MICNDRYLDEKYLMLLFNIPLLLDDIFNGDNSRKAAQKWHICNFFFRVISFLASVRGKQGLLSLHLLFFQIF